MYDHILESFHGPSEMQLFIILAVALFCWLFNSYRLEKLKKSKQSAEDRKRDDRKDTFIVGVFIAAAALIAAALESFFA